MSDPDWDGLIVRVIRHFGQSFDHWEDALTLRRHRALEGELVRRPPIEDFVAAYFEAQGWWHPPRDDRVGEAVLPVSQLPEYEP